MALTKEDLGNIEAIVGRSFSIVRTDMDGMEKRLNKRIEGVESSLTLKIERMEKRLVASIDVLQCSQTARLEEHESRLVRLEKLANLRD